MLVSHTTRPPYLTSWPGVPAALRSPSTAARHRLQGTLRTTPLPGPGRLASDAVIFGAGAARVRFARGVEEVDVAGAARFLGVAGALLPGASDGARLEEAPPALGGASAGDSLRDMMLCGISTELDPGTPPIPGEAYASCGYK